MTNFLSKRNAKYINVFIAQLKRKRSIENSALQHAALQYEVEVQQTEVAHPKQRNTKDVVMQYVVEN
jgi:hypothetical protein